MKVYEVRVRFKDGEIGSVGLHFKPEVAQDRADAIKANVDICEPLEIVDAYVLPQVVR